MRKYLVLCLVAFVTADYGHYCGLGHGDIYGREPVDELDRVCQIHDICASALGRLSCFCNEQLYASMSQVNFLTSAQEAEVDFDLSFLWDSLVLCNNHPYLRERRVFTGCTSNRCDLAGFTYLPMYPYPTSSNFFYLSAWYNVILLNMSRINYDTYFTTQAYNNPSQRWLATDPHYQRISLTADVWYEISPDTMLVFVPLDPQNISSVFLSESDMFTSQLVDNMANDYGTLSNEYHNYRIETYRQISKQNDEISHLHLYYSYKYEGYPAFLVAPDPRAYLTLIIMTVTLPVLMIGVIGYLLYRLRQKVTMMPVSQVEELLPLERDGVEGEAEQE